MPHGVTWFNFLPGYEALERAMQERAGLSLINHKAAEIQHVLAAAIVLVICIALSLQARMAIARSGDNGLIPEEKPSVRNFLELIAETLFKQMNTVIGPEARRYFPVIGAVRGCLNQEADPYHPTLNTTFLEYAQARGFVFDTARVRRPRDKGRVEKSVRDSQDDCFGGEKLQTLFDAVSHAERYCANEYGMRRHSTTQRLPREHFEAAEKSCLLAPPDAAYETPEWGECKIHRDQHAQIARGLYSLPRHYMGKTLRYRADRQTVRFYEDATLIRTAPKQPPGGRYTHPDDFPPERLAYAKRDTAYLVRRAKEFGPAVGEMAEKMLDCALPWTRMRMVYRLNRLGEKFGERLNAVYVTALSVELYDVYKIERMLKLATPPPVTQPQATVIPLARYLRAPKRLSRASGATIGDDNQ